MNGHRQQTNHAISATIQHVSSTVRFAVRLSGGYSSVWLERWFVAPEAVSSSLIIHPKINSRMIPGVYFGLIPLCYHCNGGDFVMRKSGMYSCFFCARSLSLSLPLCLIEGKLAARLDRLLAQRKRLVFGNYHLILLSGNFTWLSPEDQSVCLTCLFCVLLLFALIFSCYAR